MAFKYKCHKCGEENIVTIADFQNSGLGHGGTMADELSWGTMFMGGGPIGGPLGGSPGGPGNPFGRKAPVTNIEHKCKNCGEKNILKRGHG